MDSVYRHAGHAFALVSDARRREVRWLAPSRFGAPVHSATPCGARLEDGFRKSKLGVHADSSSALESRPRCRAQYDQADLGRCGPRARTGAGQADELEDIPESPLGRNRGDRLLHRRSRDEHRSRSVFRALRHRPEK